jgi:Porin subfamily
MLLCTVPSAAPNEVGSYEMKLVTTILLGSAAAVFVTAAGNAAEFPAQAKPMEYVKVCPQSGGDFWYVPGAATCFTAGRAESFYDLISPNQRVGSNLGATGQQVFAYTWQLGSGFSASLSAEGGGPAAPGNAGNTWRIGGKATVDLDSGPMGLGALTVGNGSYATPDIVANLRVDQSWGSAMLKAALHQNRGAYYASFPTGSGVGCTGGTANTTQCGHPDDKLGWAIGAGVALNIPGLPGDSISFETNYAQGATGYTSRANQSWRMWGDGRSIGLGWASDSVFRDGTGLELTRSWGFVAAGEHRWNPQWRTSVYGGYERIDHGVRAQDMICGRGAFAGSPSALAGLATANCKPDLSWWNIGTRTQWNPHPLLDIGLDVVYHRGTGATPANDGARAAGLVTPDDLSAMFRIQYNLRP